MWQEKESGYAVLFLIMAGVLILLLLWPINYSSPVESSFCQDSFTEPVPVVDLPAIKEGGGFDTVKKAQYKLVRKNIPLLKWFFKPGSGINNEAQHGIYWDKTTINSQQYEVYYPDDDGQVDIWNRNDFDIRLDIDALNASGARMKDFVAWGAGLIVLVTPESLNNPYSGTLVAYHHKYGDDPVFVSADIYLDTSKPELPTHTLFCTPPQTESSLPEDWENSKYEPGQQKSETQEQLQLEYFLFQNRIYGWTFHCKPAVYLYPQKVSPVTVKVHPQGLLTYTDPPYNSKTGWTIIAYPDGRILNVDGKMFDYLYFESTVPDNLIKKPEKGYVVPFENLSEFYEESLPMVGLNTKQVSDFREYWSKTLPYSPYYFVGLMDQNSINQLERLEITPKPDSMNRVRVYFEALNEFKEVDEPILKNPEMNGFKVVEWGGMVKLNKNSDFTCSL